MDPKSGCTHPSCVYFTTQRQYTAVQKMLWFWVSIKKSTFSTRDKNVLKLTKQFSAYKFVEIQKGLDDLVLYKLKLKL